MNVKYPMSNDGNGCHYEYDPPFFAIPILISGEAIQSKERLLRTFMRT